MNGPDQCPMLPYTWAIFLGWKVNPSRVAWKGLYMNLNNEAAKALCIAYTWVNHIWIFFLLYLCNSQNEKHFKSLINIKNCEL